MRSWPCLGVASRPLDRTRPGRHAIQLFLLHACVRVAAHRSTGVWNRCRRSCRYGHRWRSPFARRPGSTTLEDAGDPVRLQSAGVSGTSFNVLQVRPALGWLVIPEDDLRACRSAPARGAVAPGGLAHGRGESADGRRSRARCLTGRSSHWRANRAQAVPHTCRRPGTACRHRIVRGRHRLPTSNEMP